VSAAADKALERAKGCARVAQLELFSGLVRLLRGEEDALMELSEGAHQIRLAPSVTTSFNRAFRRWTDRTPSDMRGERPFPRPTRRSVMLLRVSFLLEEAIVARVTEGVLPPDSAVG
jgi:hypothetical protein